MEFTLNSDSKLARRVNRNRERFVETLVNEGVSREVAISLLQNSHWVLSQARELREKRVRILTLRLESLVPSAPLRLKVAVTEELRSLGWGRK